MAGIYYVGGCWIDRDQLEIFYILENRIHYTLYSQTYSTACH